MSTFNIIKKSSYEKNTDVVELKEYTVFYDETSNEKYILFKFYNTVNRPLFNFRFEVIEYDQQGKILARSIVEHKKSSIPGNEYFIPKAKHRVDSKCEDISVHLLYACFDYIYWEHDEFIQIPRSIDTFKKEPRIKIEKPRNDVKTKGKSDCTVKNIMQQNKSKFSKVFAWTFGCLCVVAVIAITIMFQIFNQRMMYKGIEYEKTTANTARVIGYKEEEFKDSKVYIPSKIGMYQIVEIAPNAFANSEITEVEIDSEDLIINTGAFANCKNLDFVSLNVCEIGVNAFEGCTEIDEIASDVVKNVRTGAFKNCTALEKISFPNASIDLLAFQNDLKVKSISFGTTTSNFLSLFVLQTDKNFTLDMVSTSMRYIPSSFFSRVTKIKNLELLNADVEIEYGALNNIELVNADIEITDTMVISGGKIISVNDKADSLVIPKRLKDDRGEEKSSFQEFLDVYGSQYLSVQILDSNVKLDSNLLNALPNVKKIILSENSKYDLAAIFQVTRLESLSMVFDSQMTIQTSMLNNLRELNFTHGYEIPANFRFSMFPSLEKVTLAKTFTSAPSSVFNDCENLIEIEMPNIAGLNINSLQRLRSINIYYSNTPSFDMAFTQLPNLVSLQFPEQITFIQGDMISYCESMTSLSIPKSCTTMGYGMIGLGMTALQSVTIPTLNAMQYKNINLSYDYTLELVIENSCTIEPETLKYCSNIRRLIAPNAQIYYLGLQYCKNIEYLDYYSSEGVRELFSTAVESISVKNLRARILSLKYTTFLYCDKLETISIDFVREDIGYNIFKQCKNLKNLYLGGAYCTDSALLNDLNSTSFVNDIIVVFQYSLGAYVFTNEKIQAYENRSISSYRYIFVYNSRQIYVNTIFVVDLKYLELSGINTANLSAYTDSLGTEKIEFPFFANKDTKIYLL